MMKTGRDSIESGPVARKMPGCGMAVMLLAGVLASAVFSGCGDEPEAEPTIVIETPVNGSTVAGPNIKLKVKTTQFKFAGAAAKRSSSHHDVEDAAGHVHVFLDKPVGLDADAILTMTKFDTATIPITTQGTHYLIVQGANAAHADYDSMIDSVMFTVTIP